MKKAACILLALLMALSLFACGKSSSSDSSATQFAEDSSYAGMSVSANSKMLEEPQTERKIIYTATVNIETTEYDRATEAIETLVSDYGGYISASESYGRADYGSSGNAVIVDRYGWFTANIPADKLNDFLAQSGDIGNVTGQTKSSSEITDRYTDNEARLNSLRTEQSRLLELLAKAENIDTLVTIEDKLGEVRGEIESIESTLKFWDKQLAYSAVTIYLSEVELYSTVVGNGRSFPQKVGDAFIGGFKSFGRFLANLTVGVVYALPYIVIIAVAAAVVIVLTKKKRKSKKEQAQSKQD